MTPRAVIRKKICMVGLYGVGKTSLVRRYVESMFDEKYHTTIGVKIDKKDVLVGGTQVNLVIWDMAGEDEIAQAKLSHLRGAAGYIVVADGLRKASLAKAREMKERIDGSIGVLPFLLVVNKADLRDQWEIGPDDIAGCEKDGWECCITSARTGELVEQVFQRLAARMMEADASARAADDDDE
jgi:small GTP-binding protein